MKRKGNTKKTQKAYSYEEYRRKFYPSSVQAQKERAESPFEVGARMAKESLQKVKVTAR